MPFRSSGAAAGHRVHPAFYRQIKDGVFSWLGSISVFHNPPETTVSSSISSPKARRSMSSMFWINFRQSMTLGSSGWRRPSASNRRQLRASGNASQGVLKALFSPSVAADVAVGSSQLPLDLQKVVEIVRIASGEIAERLHFCACRRAICAVSRSTVSLSSPRYRGTQFMCALLDTLLLKRMIEALVIFRTLLMCDVKAVDKDANHVAASIEYRLVDQIDEPFVGRTVAIAPQKHL